MTQVSEDTRPIAWVIADTETTGLTGPACEVAFREICPDTLEAIDEIQSLIDPECEIEPQAMAIHGITNEMVANEPTMAEFVEHRLGDRYHGRQIVLIAHNAQFDEKRLRDIGDITSSICTLFHARQLVPKPAEVMDHKLTTLRAHFGFPENEAHRAMADVATTHRLLKELMGRTNRTLRDFHATLDTTVHRMPWGKHSSMLLLQMPQSYIEWLWGVDLEKNLRSSLEKVMKARDIKKPKRVAA